MKKVNFSDWQEMALKGHRANKKEKTDFTRTDSLFTMLTCIGIRIDYY